jgi:magnesium transporter
LRSIDRRGKGTDVNVTSVQPGVVNCSAYSEGNKVRVVDIDDLDKLLQQPDQFVWLGLYEPDEPLLRRIQQELGLHDLAIEDAHRAHQRPKIEEYGTSLFIVLRTAQTAGDQVAFGETHIFVGERYVVTVRHGASLSYGLVRERCESTPHLLKKGPGFVLYAVMDFVVDQFFPIVDELEDRLEQLEEQVFEKSYDRATTEQIYGLKRDLVSLKRAVSPLVDVCNHLLRFDSKVLANDTRLYFRDVYDHVVRINETIDTLRELLTTALEAHLSLVSVAQNEITKKLAGWAAILAVPTMIAGVYGMNFRFMPELDIRYGYPIVLAFMAVACGSLYRGFKRSGWL